jgi:hypothetical protein
MHRSDRDVTFEDYLRGLALPRERLAEVRDSFERDHYLWEHRWRRDEVLGYVESDYEAHPAGSRGVAGGSWPYGGIDGSGTVTRIASNGARASFMYADSRARINTYGDSFTHGDQVNDGETWQEYLAAHLREPIRNFGTGGHGVYQAYRRMLREEVGDDSAEYVIIQIFGDDSTRSLYRGRHPTGMTLAASSLLVGKAYPILNTESGLFEERDNPLSTAESLDGLVDPDRVVRENRDDLALQLGLYEQGLIGELDRERIDRLSRLLDFEFDWDSPGRYAALSTALLNRYANRASIYVLDKAQEFVRSQGKRLMVILNDPFGAFHQILDGQPRHDGEILAHLQAEGFDYVDVTDAHARDFGDFAVDLAAYRARYFVAGNGHYSPAGNHFFAFVIKNKVVEWLRPRPSTYLQGITETRSSDDYLFNGQQRPEGHPGGGSGQGGSVPSGRTK